MDARGAVALAPGARSELRAPELYFTSLLYLPPRADKPDTLAIAPIPVVREGRYKGWSLPGVPRVVGALATDGRIAVGGEDASYSILVRDTAGVPVLRICRDAPPLPLTAVERLETGIPERRNDPLQGVQLHGPPGARYDVFDADGRYLGEVRAPARASLVAAAGDRVWAFETGEFDETTVVAYRLVVE